MGDERLSLYCIMVNMNIIDLVNLCASPIASKITLVFDFF